MIKLLRIELKKVSYNTSFWVLVGLYALILCVIFFGVQTFINEIIKDAGKNAPIPVTKISLYNFPQIWHNLTYLAGYFKIFLAIVIIIFMTNEYSFKTIRQNIINGLSKWDFLLSKLSLAVVLSISSTLLLLIIGLILGFLNTEELSFAMIFGKMGFLLAYTLEIFAFLLFAMLISLLVKKSGFAISLLFLYFYVIERIVDYNLPDGWGDYLPLRAIGRLIDVPNTSLMKIFGVNFREYVATQHIIVTIAYSILFIYLMYLILKKRDL